MHLTHIGRPFKYGFRNSGLKLGEKKKLPDLTYNCRMKRHRDCKGKVASNHGSGTRKCECSCHEVKHASS